MSDNYANSAGGAGGAGDDPVRIRKSEEHTVVEPVETTTSNKHGAKDFSLFAQAVAAVWVAVWSALKFVTAIQQGRIAELAITDVVLSAIAIAACFSPVYLSILMDKIRDIRFGK